MNDASSDICIFVEGIDDALFILALCVHDHLHKPRFHLIGSSVEHKHKILEQKSRKRSDAGYRSLIIMDANDHFDNYCKTIDAMGDSITGYFLLPNHGGRGCLETLLESIPSKQHSGIFDCFGRYTDCLRDKNRTYCMPDLKGKIYAYRETLGHIKAIKKMGKKYENYKKREKYTEQDHDEGKFFDCSSPEEVGFSEKHWDLDSKALEPLKHFLERHLSMTPA